MWKSAKAFQFEAQVTVEVWPREWDLEIGLGRLHFNLLISSDKVVRSGSREDSK